MKRNKKRKINLLSGIFSDISWKIILSTVGISLAVSLFFYVKYLNSYIDKLKINQTVLQSAIETQQKTINTMKVDYRKIVESREELNKIVLELKKRNDKLRETLFRETQNKKSIEELILMDQKDRIEKLINDATKKVFDCFELLSRGEKC